MSQRLRHQPDRRVFGDLQRRTFFDNIQASGEAQQQQQQQLPIRGNTPKMSLSPSGLGSYVAEPAPSGYFPPAQQNLLPQFQPYDSVDASHAWQHAAQQQHQYPPQYPPQYQAQQQQRQQVYAPPQWHQSHLPTSSWPSAQQQQQQQPPQHHHHHHPQHHHHWPPSNDASHQFNQHAPPQLWHVNSPGFPDGGEQPPTHWKNSFQQSGYSPPQQQSDPRYSQQAQGAHDPTFSSRAHLATVGRSLLGEPTHNSVHRTDTTQSAHHQPSLHSRSQVQVRTFAPNSAPGERVHTDSFSTTTARIGFGGSVECLSQPSPPPRRRGHPRTQARPEAQWYEDTLRQAEHELQQKQGVIAAGAGRLRKEQELRSQRVNARDAFKLRPAVQGEKMTATVAYSNAVGNSFFKPVA